MKFSTQQMRRLARAFHKIEDMETDRDLKRNGLTLCGYHAVREVFNDISRTGASETIQQEVADWFERCGFGVERTAYSIYLITI